MTNKPITSERTRANTVKRLEKHLRVHFDDNTAKTRLKKLGGTMPLNVKHNKFDIRRAAKVDIMAVKRAAKIAAKRATANT